LLALVEDDSPLALLTAPLTAPPRTMIPKIGCRLRKAVLQGRGGHQPDWRHQETFEATKNTDCLLHRIAE
jgi:hypothetical protein